MFFVAIALTDEKEIAYDTPLAALPLSLSESSVSAATAVEQGEAVIQINRDSQQFGISEQTGTSSSVSNYVNAWKLSKVTPSYQIIA